MSTLKQLGQQIQNARNDIRTALTDKGQVVNTDIRTYTNAVMNIPVGINTSDATATANDILFGMTAYVNSQKLVGNIPVVNDPANICNPANYDGAFFKPDDAYNNSWGIYNVRGTNTGYEGADYLVSWVAPTNNQSWYMNNQSKMKVGMPYNVIADKIGLIPNIIKNGVNILGVIGNYSGSGGMNLSHNNLEKEDFAMKVEAFDLFHTLSLADNISDLSDAFKNKTNLVNIPVCNTSNVTNMSNLFYNCQNIVEISTINTVNVTNMSNMFYNCNNLSLLNNIDMNNVIIADNMFYNCKNLINIPQFNLTNIESTSGMFNNCIGINHISINNTINLLNTSSMFENCSNLATLNTFNMNNVTNAINMFLNCGNLTTSALEKIANMLPQAINLTNQTIESIGLNVDLFTQESLTILNTKGYTDAIPEPSYPDPNYHIIYS